MNIIEWLKVRWRLFRIKYEIEPVTRLELIRFLEKKFPSSFIEVEDNLYMTCFAEQAKDIGKLVPTKGFKYKTDLFDCDNYSKIFWAGISLLLPRLPIGRCNVFTDKGKHSLNFIVYKTKSGRLSFNYIEPQTGITSYFNYRPYMLIV